MVDLSIYEVSPRDGIQNSSFDITTEEKVFLIESLYDAGLKDMEVASFVNPKYVPKMADSCEVFNATKYLDDFGVLIPNQKGFDMAKSLGAKKFNVFFSASEAFNQRNLNRTFDEKFAELSLMLENVDRADIRAYVSCAFGCPFEGLAKEHKLSEVIYKADILSENVVLCDTIGAAHPTLMARTLDLARKVDGNLALHLHNNSSNPSKIMSNVEVAVKHGITTFDASVAGLGGCPFIPGSGSNLSTNEFIAWANKNNYETGIELENLEAITQFLENKDKVLLEVC